MTALTVRLPDEKHRRLKAQLRAARGTGQESQGLLLLDKAMGQ